MREEGGTHSSYLIRVVSGLLWMPREAQAASCKTERRGEDEFRTRKGDAFVRGIKRDAQGGVGQ